jgi:hypothetical protein
LDAKLGRGMAAMDFAIQGSVRPYLFAMIWHASLAGLQQIELQHPGRQPVSGPELYGAAMRSLGTTMIWFARGTVAVGSASNPGGEPKCRE